MPSGGVSARNMADYLSIPAVPAVSGSWMVDPALLAEKRWDEVTAPGGRRDPHRGAGDSRARHAPDLRSALCEPTRLAQPLPSRDAVLPRRI